MVFEREKGLDFFYPSVCWMRFFAVTDDAIVMILIKEKGYAMQRFVLIIAALHRPNEMNGFRDGDIFFIQ